MDYQERIKTGRALGGTEMFRLIARAGGLWNMGELRRVCGDGAKRWPLRQGFPAPVWRAGATRLWLGWEVGEWLETGGRLTAAEQRRGELEYSTLKVDRGDFR